MTAITTKGLIHPATHDGSMGESDGRNKKYELDSIHACLYCLGVV